MNAIECSAKTVQDAVSKALRQSGWSLGEIEYEVVQEASAGILGIGSKPAIVRVTLIEETGASEAEKTAKPKAQGARKSTEAKQPGREPVKTEAAYKGESVDPATHPAGQFLMQLLTLMQIEPQIQMSKLEDVLYVDVLSEKMGDMIGQRGETLDAIQYLSALIINKNEQDYTRVMLDTQNYRKKRETTLQNLARRLAARARHSGRRIVLEPMNPYERRVMHATLQNSPYVRTHSEGVEPNRRVVIEPVSDGKDSRA